MKQYVVSEETANIMRHILKSRAEFFMTTPETKAAYRNVSNMLEYLLHDWTDYLKQFDYFSDKENSQVAIPNHGVQLWYN